MNADVGKGCGHWRFRVTASQSQRDRLLAADLLAAREPAAQVLIPGQFAMLFGEGWCLLKLYVDFLLRRKRCVLPHPSILRRSRAE